MAEAADVEATQFRASGNQSAFAFCGTGTGWAHFIEYMSNKKILLFFFFFSYTVTVQQMKCCVMFLWYSKIEIVDKSEPLSELLFM